MVIVGRVRAASGSDLPQLRARRLWVPAFAGATTGMTHPGKKFYPEGVQWDDPIARGTLPDLMAQAAKDFGARIAIEFRDRPISDAELEGRVETAASAFLRAGAGKNTSLALFLGNSPDHPVNFFGALK